MITEELKALVKEEADKIKKFATAEEISRLDFTTFDPRNIYYCIYGQMTYECRNSRAIELLTLCSVPYSGNFILKIEPIENYSDSFSSASPIEFYIYYKEAKFENLINYLKGNIETLEL